MSDSSQAEALREELRRRLDNLEDAPHANSECFASTRRVVIEAIAWATAAGAVWIIAIHLL